LEKNSALVVAPARHAVPIPVRRAYPLPIQHLASALSDHENDNTDSNDSVETEKEWLDESQLAELA